MSGKIKKCCHLHEEKTWTRSPFLQNLNLGSSQHRKEVQSVKPKTTSLHFNHCPSSLLRFNGIPNVQDISFFSVRPPPKFFLINLFMSILSPAALTQPQRRRQRERRKTKGFIKKPMVMLVRYTFFSSTFLSRSLLNNVVQ